MVSTTNLQQIWQQIFLKEQKKFRIVEGWNRGVVVYCREVALPNYFHLNGAWNRGLRGLRILEMEVEKEIGNGDWSGD